MANPDKLLETNAVCDLMGVTRQTLVTWERNGILKPLPRRSTNERKRYRFADIKELMGNPIPKEQSEAIAATEVVHVDEALTQKHEGHFADHFPAELKDAYDKAGKDPNLAQLIDDLRTTRAMLMLITRRMRDGEPSAKMWRHLRSLGKELTSAMRLNDRETMNELLLELLKAIARGCPEVELQDEYIRTSKHRCELLELKIKQEQFLSKFVTQERAIARAVKEAELLKKYFGDQPEKLEAFALEWSRVVFEE